MHPPTPCHFWARIAPNCHRLFSHHVRLPTNPLRRSLPSIPQQTSTFSTSTPSLAKGVRQKVDRRITLIRYHLNHPKTPRPLRFSRLRALRHWTIHRAAMLYRDQQRRAHELELERQYNAMRAACEELRVGVGDGGRLFRQAMVRKGIFGGKAQSEGVLGEWRCSD
ncbi:hypothetical protein G7Y79_00002g005270 [Physcia stellaris]|nr:hypothetical protein G7Y79_00002g005270 [Physcia stellaris]